MIAVVAAGATLLPAPVAHAGPGCSAAHQDYDPGTQRGLGSSTCPNEVQRVKVTCYDAMVGAVYTVYGPLVGPGQVSTRPCDTFGWALSATWSYT
ncbi:hypothetical protein [Lentzea terrae]|jgi:hypothetical protein|uniref:hypothetical protein n=1 Tax=Lentzea terrae TaxID=2200761 RepID=UPI000DD47FBC|nr:hypothetical protein [Lentzea terrae]